MRALPLDAWLMLDFAPGEGLSQAAATDGGDGWMQVSAPGDTYLGLVKAGRLPHPWRGRAETEAAWVRDREWWWRTEFAAPESGGDEAVALVFEGLDTFAAIYLDGEEIGRSDNMFRQVELDLGARLTPGGRHTLAVRFDPPALAAPQTSLPVWTSFTDRVSVSRRNLMRKAQFGWGWDWGPDLPTVGIWKPARIEVRPRARIEPLQFQTVSLRDGQAEVRIQAEARHVDATLEVSLSDPDGREVHRASGPADRLLILDAAVPSPRLWWTADLGDQPLYTLEARLLEGDRVLDSQTRRVGIRMIEIDQSPDPADPASTLFRFVLNGEPLFTKGACWVPSTSFVAEVDAAAYARLVDQTVVANMNMLRVWGGGIYEPELFYDLCDERGVLVWQDFMFACAHYPDAPAFLDSVRGEVEDQVLRLRHHPCLAVWCGNNENQAIHRIDSDRMGVDTPLSGLVIYDDLIPEVLGQLDPGTPYRPSSPWGGSNPNGMRAGDVHDWTVWHGVPPIPNDTMEGPFRSDPEGLSFRRYAEDLSSFVSEFGIQAAPAMATLERWMDPADLNPAREGFRERIKDEARKAEALIAGETGPATTLQQYVDFTQWTQAEGLKFGIEHFRRRRPSCSGALIWQLNDCWPCVSWSLIDHDGVEKAAYWAVRRAFAPVLASFREAPGDTVELWISNDTLSAIAGEATLSLDALDGQTIWRETLGYEADTGGHAVVWRGPRPREASHVLRVQSADGGFDTNRLLAGPIIDLPLQAGARPAVSVIQTEPNSLEVTLEAATYLAFVHLVSDRADLRFSDNFLDLAAGERRTIRVSAPTSLSPEDVTVRCWNAEMA